MEFIKSKIGSFGGLLAVFGFVSIVLSFFDYNLRALGWIDMWGTGMGWFLRIAFIIAGVALYVAFSNNEETEESKEK